MAAWGKSFGQAFGNAFGLLDDAPTIPTIVKDSGAFLRKLQVSPKKSKIRFNDDDDVLLGILLS